jgi:drug/metabolite transporter (DMT)-like permease
MRGRGGVGLALLAAAAFGFANLAARTSSLPPLLLAASAYLLGGLMLSPSLRRLRVSGGDRWRLAAMGIVGGALAPALLFFGLRETRAVEASLLLTLEMVFTALLARLVLGERSTRRSLLGSALLFAAAVVVAARAQGEGASSLRGAALVALASLGWAVDNTLSARLVADHPPAALVSAKGLIGGGAALVAALVVGPMVVPSGPDALRILYVGVVAMGLSTFLFNRALQDLGASRTTALFLPGVALAGALGGAAFLHEPLGWEHAVAAALIVVGAPLAVGKS